MNVYPQFLRALSEAEVDVPAVAWAIQGVTGTFGGTDDFLNDVTTVGAKGTIPGVAVTVTATGVDYDTTAISQATAITLTGVATSDVDAFVVFVDTGVAGTARLAYYIDRRAGNTPVAFTGDGGNVLVWFPSGYFMGGR